MQLNTLDMAVFLGFMLAVVGFSMYKSRRERTSEDYFLAGRGLTWPLIGFSIVAANLSTEQFVGMAGQAAGNVGLAVSNWQLTGAVGIVVVAFTFLPRFLRGGIYTMPEYLEYRYNASARAIMAVYTVVVYVLVTVTTVLYSGGLTLQTIFGMDLRAAIWLIGVIAAVYHVGRAQSGGLGGSVSGLHVAAGRPADDGAWIPRRGRRRQFLYTQRRQASHDPPI